eukprot:jgi/Ulvmu1/1987/UM012_0149.1
MKRPGADALTNCRSSKHHSHGPLLRLAVLAALSATAAAAAAAGSANGTCAAAAQASLRALEELNSTATSLTGCSTAAHGQVCSAHGVAERCASHPDCARDKTTKAEVCSAAGAEPECCVSFYHQHCEGSGDCRTTSKGLCHQTCSVPAQHATAANSAPLNSIPASTPHCEAAALAALDSLAAADPVLATTVGCGAATTGVVCGVSAQLGECAPVATCKTDFTAEADECAVHAGRCCFTYYQKECSQRGAKCAVKPMGMCFVHCAKGIPTGTAHETARAAEAPSGVVAVEAGRGGRPRGRRAAVGGVIAALVALVALVVIAAVGLAVGVRRRRRARQRLAQDFGLPMAGMYDGPTSATDGGPDGGPDGPNTNSKPSFQPAAADPAVPCTSDL